MKREEFLALKPGDRFTHEFWRGEVFTVKALTRGVFGPVVNTECDSVFTNYARIHLIEAAPAPEQPSDMQSCEEFTRQALAILQERRKQWGPPQKNFQRFAAMLTAYLGIEVKDYQAADVMVLLKMCRLAENGTAKDGRIDSVNYSILGAVLAEGADDE